VYGRDIIFDNELGYIRIHIDIEGYCRSITYLGKQGIPVDNYLSLYGTHEKYMNRILARYDEGVIENFKSFLAETWALPLYHDRFKGFIQGMNQEVMAYFAKDTYFSKKLLEYVQSGNEV